MVSVVQIIRKKRDGEELSDGEIKAFIAGATSGKIPSYQVTSFLMAVWFRGMNLRETTSLTQAMIESSPKESGAPFRWPENLFPIDKHSTGGVGDKVSIILAPLAASLGLTVPMVAGRGLGHTGGTLDKLESIPKFSAKLSNEEFQSLVLKVGTGIMGQTKEFVPADGLLYSLRDVTATVDSIPLITASILSKKVSEGIKALVMDLKVGNGAFMRSIGEARRLAERLKTVGAALGVKVRVLITDMNQPLGLGIGNSIEIIECVDLMLGKPFRLLPPEVKRSLNFARLGYSDLKDLTIELAAHMLILTDKVSSLVAGRRLATQELKSKRTLQKFHEMLEAQNANPLDVKNLNLPLTVSPVLVRAPQSGTVSEFDTRGIGELIVQMGGGRQKQGDPIDFSVGAVLCAKLGHKVKAQDPLALLYVSPQLRGTIEKDFLSLVKIQNSRKTFRPEALVKAVVS